VIGSCEGVNCRAEQKLETIRKRFGESFDYIGDSRADLVLWQNARGAYLVSPSKRLLKLAKQRCEPRELFVAPSARWKAIVRALRPVQWVKNLLVLLPLLLAHKANQAPKLAEAIFAFVAFCLCASGVYVINDLLDIEHDRHHPRKRSRPFACGAVPIPVGVAMVAGLLVAAFAIALAVSAKFAGVLLVYVIATTAYSLAIKGRLVMDVILLAALYTIRLIAGAVAVSVTLSEWLLAFSMFLFISLAFVKRYSELMMLQSENKQEIRGRGYMLPDLEIIQSVGPTSGYLAVLVFCQYISSDTARALYKRPEYLWLMCPVLLYWITRVWVLARRRALTDDPLVFAMTDKMSWICGAVTLLLAVAATL
jgi:4-hydroxybenzoate polyprenyltransferase